MKFLHRFLLLCNLIFVFLMLSSLNASEIKAPDNHCAQALNQLSEYRAEAIYGSPLEGSWHPVAFYKLIHRMRLLLVIEEEFRDQTEEWFFEFVKLKGGRTVAFVGNRILHESACQGPNAFFVLKKE